MSEPAAEKINSQTYATVTSSNPLRVRVDGAATECLANKLDGASYNPNDRVTVIVRNPLPPLIEGKES